jgi:hypothetical protein
VLSDLLQWLLHDILMGAYRRFVSPSAERLPRSIRMGCSVIGWALIAAFVGLVIYTLIWKASQPA